MTEAPTSALREHPTEAELGQQFVASPAYVTKLIRIFVASPQMGKWARSRHPLLRQCMHELGLASRRAKGSYWGNNNRRLVQG